MPLKYTRLQISRATPRRMKYSPAPVPETAQDWLDAYVPAPMIGESPTRPGILACMPPVDVPAATLPWRSRATTPTVPYVCVSDDSSICATGITGPVLGTPWGRGGMGRP